MAAKLLSKQDWAKESVSFAFGILSTAIGFFLALWVNSYLDDQKEIETFKTAKRMIVNETKINKKIVDKSFVKYAYETPGLIYADMTTSNSEEMIKDQKFISHTNDTLLYTIQSYLRYVRILNTYKGELNQIRMKEIDDNTFEKKYAELEDSLVKNILYKRDSLVFYIDLIQKDIGNLK